MMLRKRENTTVNIEPNEGERTLLRSSKSSMRSPSLDLEQERLSKDAEIKELSKIFVEYYLWLISKQNESKEQ